MPDPERPDLPPRPPTCTRCGKQMRLVSTAPDTPYTNISRADFVCDCGQVREGLVADKD